jgi:hypothetical protein
LRRPGGGGCNPGGFYCPRFRNRTAGLGLYAALYVWVALQGRWRVWTHRAAIACLIAIALLLGVHAPLAQQGLVFVSPVANQTAVPLFALIGAFMLLGSFYEIYRDRARGDPAPVMESPVR